MLSVDTGIAVALIAAFAGFITVHVSLAFGLILRHEPRWQAWLTLFPLTAWLAPVLGHRHAMRARVALWAILLMLYVATLTLAYTRR